jgi:hypothetical protein
MIDLATLTIAKAHESLKKGEYTVRQLVDAYLAEIEKKNKELNVYQHLFTDIDERQFEDTVMQNFDVRELKDDNGDTQLYYSFPTRTILIIAESKYSFPEILSRLRADRRL